MKEAGFGFLKARRALYKLIACQEALIVKGTENGVACECANAASVPLPQERIEKRVRHVSSPSPLRTEPGMGSGLQNTCIVVV